MIESIHVGLPKEIMDKMGVKTGTTIKGFRKVPVEYIFELEE